MCHPLKAVVDRKEEEVEQEDEEPPPLESLAAESAGSTDPALQLALGLSQFAA